MTNNLKKMMTEHKQRYEALRHARGVVFGLNEEYTKSSKELTAALIAAGGYYRDQIIKLKDGGEAKINYMRLTDNQELLASCYDKTANGTWSKRARRLVTLNVKIEEEAQ